MPNVTPRSSAARFSIQWPLAVPLPSRCRSGDQRSDDLRVAQSGAGRPRSATGLSRAEQTELSAANKRIRELENKVAILKRPVSCSESHTTRRSIRGGLLRMAITATVPARDSTCLADRTDPCRAFRVSGHLRCPARPRLGLTLGHGQVEMLMARACPAPQRRTPRQCTVNYE